MPKPTEGQGGGGGGGEPEGVKSMELDFDLDNSFPLDQISFISSNPMSPLLISTSTEQPCSPLWAFSDAVDDRLAVTAAACQASPAAPRLSDYPIFLTINPNSIDESQGEIDDNSKFPSPFLGLMPIDNPDGYCMIKERMTQALRYFKESTEQHVLAQVWAPVSYRGQHVLTTSGQPFVLDPRSNGLHQYRMVSLMYTFSVDDKSNRELGLPGRVFRQKSPEWTPNVQYYSSKEYSRLDHAQRHNVRGTLALPVFEPSGQSCVGVVELIMNSQKINYAPEVDKVCKALEAVDLKSSEILDPPCIQICNEGRQNALSEILEILTMVCETHKLPLAQTWVPCMHRSVLTYGGGLKKSCTSFDGNCNGQVCMSTTDVAFYVVDAHIWGFREACLEHHLQKGQGVAGRAFLSHSSCFCPDITQFSKNEYPLVHYARMFGLTSCFAIFLRSSYTGDDEYILEFFLPPSITDSHEQKTLLGSILSTMKQDFQSLKVASGMDLEDEGFVEMIQATTNGKLDLRLECIQMPQPIKYFPDDNALPNEVHIGEIDSEKNELMFDLDDINYRGSAVQADKRQTPASHPEKKETKKPSERKRGKAEKTISLEVLQQYFAGSLKDAAKRLGVCPTTMKRICRQHGISRWPSRKINKSKGSEGTFDLTPLTTSPLHVAVGAISWPSNLNGSNQQNSPDSKPPEYHGDRNGSSTCRTSGSDGQAGLEDQLKGCRTPTSHGSCQDNPENESAPVKDPSASPFHERCIKAGGVSPETKKLNMSAAFSILDALVATEAQEPFCGMLIEDAGSSKDLRNLCPAVADATVDEGVPESSWADPPCSNILSTQMVAAPLHAIPHATPMQEMKRVTIKATYREDVIRFRISLSCGIVELKEEVAKRLKLEVGTFDIKYLDDDRECVLIACDADLLECMDVSRSSSSNIIRLSVHDANANLGSSCESTGEL
ncbi:PLANT REGULATOR RWP-RK FAMILY PROTEIN [Salix viminalis]|uniref:PLANT REGULATOR RWP-RK FAMILY PROTEIN n=1 Tax=Salix viminalis TaxID=40686 RepID=A0A9Q0T7K1_SALVM|nr:PLANT REGULATOR RWP-RK FAMILY PROTEIN [Salix viminalis]